MGHSSNKFCFSIFLLIFSPFFTEATEVNGFSTGHEFNQSAYSNEKESDADDRLSSNQNGLTNRNDSHESVSPITDFSEGSDQNDSHESVSPTTDISESSNQKDDSQESVSPVTDFSDALNQKDATKEETDTKDDSLTSSKLKENDSCCANRSKHWDIWIYPNYLYFGYTGGRGISYKRGYTTLGLFLAPSRFAYNQFQSFFDAKGYVFNDGKWNGSVGVGTRYLLSSQNIVLGCNVYYDYRRFHRFDLNQIGVGLELLSPCWDFRFNGYIPVGERNFHKGILFDFSGEGDFIAIRNRRASAWYGVDSEVGTWLKRKYSSDWFGIYFAAGPYYYWREHERRFENGRRRRDAVGGRARLLARISDFVDVSVIATYDSVWHTRVQGQITIAIPFDCKAIINKCTNKCACNPCSCLLLAIQPVQRNGIIVADRECCWLWNWSDCSEGYSSSDSRSASRSDSSSSCSSCSDCPSAHSISLSSIDNFSSDFFKHSCSGK
jgi:hypothetical protein